MKPKLIAGLIAGALVVGGGVYAASRFFAPRSDAAIELVPANALVYANVFVDPSMGQKRAIDELLKKFPQTRDGFESAKDSLLEQLDPVLQEVGLSFEKDIEPVLGEQIALYLLPPDEREAEPSSGAALIAVEDDGAALEVMERAVEESSPEEDLEDRSYEGVEYRAGTLSEGNPAVFGVVDGFLVVGTEHAFKASVDARDGSSLAFEPDFRVGSEGLEDDHLAFLYMDGAALFELAGVPPEFDRAEASDLFGRLGYAGPLFFSVHATGDSVVLETSQPNPKGAFKGLGAMADADLMESFPADSWVALALPDLGGTIDGILGLAELSGEPSLSRRSLETRFRAEIGLGLEEDVLSWMGDAGAFVRGTNITTLGGAVVIESSDAGKTATVVEKIRSTIEAGEPGATQPLERDGAEGFTFNIGPAGPINVLGGERFVVAYGDAATDAVLDPDETLPDGETFADAMRALDGSSPALYLDAATTLRVFESFVLAEPNVGEGPVEYEREVRPILERFRFVVAGSKIEGDTLYQRLVVGVK